MIKNFISLLRLLDVFVVVLPNCNAVLKQQNSLSKVISLSSYINKQDLQVCTYGLHRKNLHTMFRLETKQAI